MSEMYVSIFKLRRCFPVTIERGAFMTAGSSVSGTAYGDRNGYELTISGMEEAPSFEVTGSIVEA